MPKNIIIRSLVVVVCLGILATAVPSLNSAGKATAKANYVQFVKQPLLILSTLLPMLNPYYFEVVSSSVSTTPAGLFPRIVRPTGDMPVIRPSTGD